VQRCKKLYDECNIPLEIEPTSYHVKYINNPFGDKIFCDIGIGLKKNFIDNYLPLLLKHKELSNEIALSEECYFSNCQNVNKEESKTDLSDPQNIITKLGINIPDNIAEKKMHELEDKKIEYIKKLFPKYQKNEKCDTLDMIPAFNSHLKCNNYILKDLYYPYNEIFNSLYPEFSDNCCLATDNYPVPYNNAYIKKEENKKAAKNIVVIFNLKYWNTLVLEKPFLIHLDMLNKHPEYGFLKLFSLPVTNEKIVKVIYEKLNNVIFENAADLNKTLNVLSDFIHLVEEDEYNSECRNAEYEMEEEQVRDFLDNYYESSNDEKDKIKLYTICKMIQDSFVVSIKENAASTFQNRLSKYLTRLGWKRKYFEDGFYYYGMKYKFDYDLKKLRMKCSKDVT